MLDLKKKNMKHSEHWKTVADKEMKGLREG